MFDTNNYSSKIKIKNTALSEELQNLIKKNTWKRCKIDTPKHTYMTIDFPGLVQTLQ